MFIVTATDGARRAGCLVGFGGQCSIEPARFMVWLSQQNYTRVVAQRTGRLAVHIPTARDRDLAVLFGSVSGFTVDKFDRCAWCDGANGVPLLLDCPQWFVGRIVQRYDTGDHDGILLEPTHVADTASLGQLDFHAVRDFEVRVHTGTDTTTRASPLPDLTATRSAVQSLRRSWLERSR
jgi:flavin reductase (DIM6/NTAB) family NADH-FMN oxidoreductase RutF